MGTSVEQNDKRHHERAEEKNKSNPEIADPNNNSELEELKDKDIDFPDGGLRAWLVVFGAFCSAFSTGGYVNAWGVFQAYYQSNTLSHLPASKIALIGTLQNFTSFAISVFVGRLFDIGFFRIPLLISSCIIVVGTILIGECKTYWQIFLCQAIALGLAIGIMFSYTFPVVSHWFKERRATALGITATGLSVGGAALPIIIRELTSKIGFKWTMRVLGFVFLGTTGCVNLCMRRRLPPTKVAGGFFNLKAFKSAPFSWYMLATFICSFGIDNVLIYIDVSASVAGIPPSLSVYFLVIANGVGAIGRILMGILADKIGCLSVMIPLTFIGAFATYTWPLANSIPSLTAIAVIYGFCSGTFLGLISVPLIHMGETVDVGRRAGMLYTLNGLAIFAGAPISGAIISKTGSYQGAGIFAGTMILVAVVLLWVTRYSMTGGLFKGKF